MDAFNWIAALWTVIGGPAIGLWISGQTDNKQDGALWGWIVGAGATVVILLASFGLWKLTGFPPMWSSFLQR